MVLGILERPSRAKGLGCGFCVMVFTMMDSNGPAYLLRLSCELQHRPDVVPVFIVAEALSEV